MEYYKYLNLPFESKLAPVDMQQDHIELDSQLIDPIFINWLDSFDIKILHSEIFQKVATGPQFPHILHVDGNVFDDHVKINFVLDPGISVMRWWRLKPGKEFQRRKTIIDTDYLYAYRNDCDQVAECQMLKPTLVNVGQLHSVEKINTTRLCYSFTLFHKKSNSRVMWNDAVEIFKDYI